jgi:hypothetical protein
MFLTLSGWCFVSGRDGFGNPGGDDLPNSRSTRNRAVFFRLFFPVSVDKTGDAFHGGADLFQGS